MIGHSSDGDPITEENCEAIYRPPEDGEEGIQVHAVAQITPKQVHIEKAVKDAMPAASESGRDGHWQLCLRELELYGSVYHTPTCTRYYRSREAARAAQQ
jgi:hypothetical protein